MKSKYCRLIYIFLALMLLASSAYAEGKTVEYTVNGAIYEGYYISPADNAPLILMIHDWDGLTDYEVKRSAMLAEQGYAVFAADMFGKGIRPTEVEDKKKLTGELYQDRKKMRSLLNGALETAAANGGNTGNAVAMGYCFGGSVVLELARSGADLKGFVSFHGGLETPEGQSYADTKGELLVLHGSADAMVTMDHFAALTRELEEHKIDHEMISYAGAPHAFTVFGSSRYREKPDKRSWARFLSFLNEVLK